MSKLNIKSKSVLKDKAIRLFSISLIIPFTLFIIIGYLGLNSVITKRDKNYLLSALAALKNAEEKSLEQFQVQLEIISESLSDKMNLDERKINSIINRFPDIVGYSIYNKTTEFTNIDLNSDLKKYLLNPEEDFNFPLNVGFFIYKGKILYIGYKNFSINGENYSLILLWMYYHNSNIANFLRNYNLEIIIHEQEQFSIYTHKKSELKKELVRKIMNSKQFEYFSEEKDVIVLNTFVSNILRQPIAIRILSIDKTMITRIKQTFWLAGIILSLISLMLASYLSKKLAGYLINPIENLSRKMDSVAKDPINSGDLCIDEFTSLEMIVTAFNNILESFKTYYNSVLIYERLVRNLNEGVFWADAEGDIRIKNKAFDKIYLQMNNDTEKNIFRIFPEDIFDENSDVIESKEIVIRGTYYLFSLNKINEKDNTGYIGLLHNVNEQKNAEKTRKKLENKLAISRKLAEVGLLIEGISHNLNSPLNNLMGFAQLLEQEFPNNEDVKKILQNSERMKNIIKSLMNRLSEEMIFAPHKVNINDLITKELEYFKHNLFFKNMITKKIYLDAELPLFYCIYSDISQSFANLLSNAIEALSNCENRNISISTFRDENDIFLTIEDTGPGIPEEILQEITEPMVTVKKRKDLVRGLGLAITKQLIEHYGGKLLVESRIGFGSKFTIQLPLNYTYNDSSDYSVQD